MADVVLAFDPSSSLSKAFYSLNPFRLEWLVMEPEVAKVSKASIAQYEANKIGQTTPENEAWVEVEGNYYALGFLAKHRFYGDLKLLSVKFETAIPKVLAMVGAIAFSKRLSSEFTLSLGILLPFGEYEDRKRFKPLIAKALSNFRFRGKVYRVKLVAFNCLPEGAGLLMRGLDYQQCPSQRDVLVVMVGYRNASFLLSQRGRIVRGETTDLGFVRMLERVMESTSGLKAPEMVAAVCTAGRQVDENALRSLVRSQASKLQKRELKQIANSVRAARYQHWEMLANWMLSRRFPPVNEVVLAGGTARYYSDELESYFASSSINWGERLEDSLKKIVGQTQWCKELAYRLTDAYGYFYYVQSILKKIEQQAA